MRIWRSHVSSWVSKLVQLCSPTWGLCRKPDRTSLDCNKLIFYQRTKPSHAR
jgi:hypothetical protein